ncbi:hypothetical protein GCM10027415_30370 [Humibacter ginsengisoli]
MVMPEDFSNFFIVASSAALVVVVSQVMYETFAPDDPEPFDEELQPASARPVSATAANAAVMHERCM